MLQTLCLIFGMILGLPLWSSVFWWGPATLSDQKQQASDLKIAICYETGKAFVSWKAFDGVTHSIQVSRFDGAGWSLPITLFTEGVDQTVSSHEIGINQLDHGIAIFRVAERGNLSFIKASYFDGSAWSEPTSIFTGFVTEGVALSLSKETDQALVLWKNSSTNSYLQSAKFDGSSWSLLEDFTPHSQSMPQVAFFNQNRITAASWLSQIEGQVIAFASIYQNAWSTPTLFPKNGRIALTSSIASDPQTEEISLLWSSLNYLEFALWDGAHWSNQQTIAGPASFFVEPSLLYHPTDSTLAAIWRDPKGIRGTFYHEGTWLPPITISSSGTQISGAFNPVDGQVGVLWNLNGTIQFAEYNSEGASSKTTLTAPNASAELPHLTIDSTGHCFAIWSVEETDGYRVIQVCRGASRLGKSL